MTPMRRGRDEAGTTSSWGQPQHRPNRPRTPTTPPTTMVRGRADLRIVILAAIVIVGGCGWFDDDAREALGEAEQSLARGVDRAREQVDVDAAARAVHDTVARSADRLSPPDSGSPDWLADPQASIACEADTCTVAAGLVAQAWQQPQRAAPGLGLEPVLVDGVATGLRLRGLEPGSPAFLLGFRNGDVVQTVNHLPVAWPQSQPRVLWQLRHGRRFDVTFERDGRTLSRTVVVQ